MAEKYLATVIEVTCPECKETYNIRTDQHKKTRNCRCSRGSFEIELGFGRDHARVYFIDSIGARSEFSNWRIIAQS